MTEMSHIFFFREVFYIGLPLLWVGNFLWFMWKNNKILMFLRFNEIIRGKKKKMQIVMNNYANIIRYYYCYLLSLFLLLCVLCDCALSLVTTPTTPSSTYIY